MEVLEGRESLAVSLVRRARRAAAHLLDCPLGADYSCDSRSVPVCPLADASLGDGVQHFQALVPDALPAAYIRYFTLRYYT